MVSNAIDRRPGQFAEERFKLRRRAWRRRIWWVLPLVVVVVFGPAIAIAGVINPGHFDFYVGLAIGAAAAMALYCLDSPPQHIENWRTGADGEKRTARALRPLLREGWVLLNDLPRTFGNIDHVLIGPPGVFLLETKNLTGLVSVVNDSVDVRWLEEPEDGYVNDSIGRRARGAAAELSRALGPRGPWVQAVVVLWARFEQGSIEGNYVLWETASAWPMSCVHGRRRASTSLRSHDSPSKYVAWPPRPRDQLARPTGRRRSDVAKCREAALRATPKHPCTSAVRLALGFRCRRLRLEESSRRSTHARPSASCWIAWKGALA